MANKTPATRVDRLNRSPITLIAAIALLLFGAAALVWALNSRSESSNPKEQTQVEAPKGNTQRGQNAPTLVGPRSVIEHTGGNFISYNPVDTVEFLADGKLLVTMTLAGRKVLADARYQSLGGSRMLFTSSGGTPHEYRVNLNGNTLTIEGDRLRLKAQ